MKRTDNHIVIDLETLDTVITAKVLSVGYAIVSNGEIVQQAEYRVLLDDQPARTVSDDTLLWWLDGEKAEAQRHLVQLRAWPVRVVLERMTADVDVFGGWDRIKVWGNSPNFDCDILGSLFGGKPWKFYNERDLRTLRDIHGGPREAPEIPHTALYDAVAEAKDLCNYLRTLP